MTIDRLRGEPEGLHAARLLRGDRVPADQVVETIDLVATQRDHVDRVAEQQLERADRDQAAEVVYRMPAAREQEPPVVEARTVEHDAAEPSADHRQTGAEPAAIVEQPGHLDREEIVPGLSGHQDRSVSASETPKASNRSAVEVPEPAGPSLEPEQDRSEGTRSGGAELDASAAVTTGVEPTAEATVEDPARETERSVDAAPSAPEQREAEETVQESAEVEHRQAAERERAAEAQERAPQQEREYESPHHEQEMEMDMDGMDMGM